MSAMTLRYVDSRTALDKWARAHRARVRVVDETWESITYAADALGRDGTREEYRYRLHLPVPLALRRRERTFVVGLSHMVDGAECVHVRPVIAGLSAATEAEAARQAVMVAAATVELQRRCTCGARVDALSAYTVQPAALWDS
ncbi:hypothetical protein ACFVWN_04510 [Nocardiopsis flavescens]|uniref:hypothetical protein n=1 Tax=Nocardiopsis flavescens TaxID=758803 RepID=UPI00365CC039